MSIFFGYGELRLINFDRLQKIHLAYCQLKDTLWSISIDKQQT
jgi:hypothetical protein